MTEELDLEDSAPWWLAFITLVGGLLRVLLLGNKGMWLDETFSVWLANHSVGEMLHWIVQIDQHPPLYYLLLHWWIGLRGDMPGAVRMLSALLGTATIPMVYLIGKRLSGVTVGLAAAALLALSPFNVHFAQDARMYTLLAFNASVAIYALVRLLTDPRAVRPIGSQFREYIHAWRTLGPAQPDPKDDFSYKDLARRQTGWRGWISRHRWSPIQTIETDLAWIVFIVFSALTLLTHNTAVLYVLAVNLFVLALILLQRKKRPESPLAFQAPSFWNWAKAQIGIFILWSPWIYAFITQASRVYQEFWVPQPTWDSVVQVLGSFIDQYSFVPAGLSLVVWIFYALVLCLGLVYYRKNLSRLAFLATLFAVPFLGELLVSIRRPIFLDRTLIWTTIPLLLVLAGGIAQLKFRPLILVVLGMLCANNMFSTSNYYRFVQSNEDWDSATRQVVASYEEGDLVLFNATWVQIPFDYYFKTFDRNSVQVQKFTHAEEHGVPSDLFDSGILEPKMTRSDVPRLISMLEGHDRVWLVYSHNSYTDPQWLIPQTLASQMKLIEQENFYGVQVRLYGSP